MKLEMSEELFLEIVSAIKGGPNFSPELEWRERVEKEFRRSRK